MSLRFFEVRDILLDWLNDASFCTYNARLIMPFSKMISGALTSLFKKLLGTVKLSRKLYPQHKRSQTLALKLQAVLHYQQHADFIHILSAMKR